MRVTDIDAFRAMLQERGYAQEKNRSRAAMGYADDQWWKAFGRTNGHRHYTVVLRLYDHSKIEGYDHERFGRWGVSFLMSINHESPVLCEVMRMEMSVEDMDLQGWEQRCAELYEAMASLWPRPVPEEQQEP